MKSLFFLISLFLCFSIITPSYSQDNVPVRIGERDGYLRLTFGWVEKAEYVLDKSQNEGGHASLSIKFDHSANIDLSAIDFSLLDNIAAMRVVSTAPLEVSFLVPKSSNIRDFKIGKRIVIDIYDPANPDDLQSFSKSFNKQKIGKQPSSKIASSADLSANKQAVKMHL